MVYFIVIIEGILIKRLARLFRDNIWKLYRLLESVMSDRRLQFVVNLTKKLNKMLGIKTKLFRNLNSICDSLWIINKKIGQNITK